MNAVAPVPDQPAVAVTTRPSFFRDLVQVGADLYGSRLRTDPRSGKERNTVVLLVGAVEDAALMQDKTVVLRVRSAAPGQIVFATSLPRCGGGSDRGGHFRIRISPEMNVRPGVYALSPVS